MAIVNDTRQRASGIFARVHSLADRVVSQETRSQFYSNVKTFANGQPLLAAFLFIQLLVSFTPLAIFFAFVLGTILLSFITAALFCLFWIGVALVILIPTLFVTVSIGIMVWIWAVLSFIVARWVYNVVPIRTKGKTEIDLYNGKKVVVSKTGEGFGDAKAEVNNGVDSSG